MSCLQCLKQSILSDNTAVEEVFGQFETIDVQFNELFTMFETIDTFGQYCCRRSLRSVRDNRCPVQWVVYNVWNNRYFRTILLSKKSSVSSRQSMSSSMSCLQCLKQSILSDNTAVEEVFGQFVISDDNIKELFAMFDTIENNWLYNTFFKYSS